MSKVIGKLEYLSYLPFNVPLRRLPFNVCMYVFVWVKFCYLLLSLYFNFQGGADFILNK
jgi:hypothetical protein